MNKLQYKLTNTTKWAGAKKGKHKHGFILAINRRNLHVNRHMVVDDISESIEALQKKRYLKIDLVENRQVSIKQDIEKTEKENQLLREKAEIEVKTAQQRAQADAAKRAREEADRLAEEQAQSQPASSLDKDHIKEQLKNSMPENTARVAGEDDSLDPLADVEQPVDDNPNFVVKAGGRSKRKKNRSEDQN